MPAREYSNLLPFRFESKLQRSFVLPSRMQRRGAGGRRRTILGRASGFTLLELMITITVLAILTVIAFPSMQNLIRRDRVKAQSNSMMADLQFARGQAAATRSYVSICPLATAGSTTCDTAGGSYDLGWLVFNAASPNTTYGGTAANLQRVEAAPSMTSIRADASGVLTFDARGELLISGTPTEAIFVTCAKSSAGDTVGTSTATVPGVQLDVSESGRVASSQWTAGSACDPAAD